MFKNFIPLYILLIGTSLLATSEFKLIELTPNANKIIFCSGAAVFCLGGLLGRRLHKINKLKLQSNVIKKENQ